MSAGTRRPVVSPDPLPAADETSNRKEKEMGHFDTPKGFYIMSMSGVIHSLRVGRGHPSHGSQPLLFYWGCWFYAPTLTG